MPRRLLPALLIIIVALVGWAAAGPWIAIHGIRTAIEQRDASRLDRHVDFPELRANLKRQYQQHGDALLGLDRGGIIGGLLGRAADALGGVAIDALATPAGIDAILQGDLLYRRASNDLESTDTYARPRAARPLKDASHRYESLSRFTTTATTPAGAPVVFVLTRQGLVWKLTDIRLPWPGQMAADAPSPASSDTAP